MLALTTQGCSPAGASQDDIMCDPTPPPASNFAGVIKSNLHKSKVIKSAEDKAAWSKTHGSRSATRYGNVAVLATAIKFGGAAPAPAVAAAAPAPSSVVPAAKFEAASQVTLECTPVLLSHASESNPR